MAKPLKRVVAIATVLGAAVIVFWRFAPPQLTENVAKNLGPAKDLLCQYPVKVQGEAMMPIFKHGQIAMLSKCIDDRGNIAPGTVILYERPGGMRLSVIREKITDANGTFYRASQEARRSEIDEVRPDRIIAIYNK